MLPDPVTVTAASPTPELKFGIIKHDNYGSVRIDNNGNPYQIIINHDTNKTGTRHYVQVVQEKDAVDPYSSLTRRVRATASFTLVRPTFGFSDAEMVAVGKLLTDFRDDSEVTMAKLLLWQS